MLTNSRALPSLSSAHQSILIWIFCFTILSAVGLLSGWFITIFGLFLCLGISIFGGARYVVVRANFPHIYSSRILAYTIYIGAILTIFSVVACGFSFISGSIYFVLITYLLCVVGTFMQFLAFIIIYFGYKDAAEKEPLLAHNSQTPQPPSPYAPYTSPSPYPHHSSPSPSPSSYPPPTSSYTAYDPRQSPYPLPQQQIFDRSIGGGSSRHSCMVRLRGLLLMGAGVVGLVTLLICWKLQIIVFRRQKDLYDIRIPAVLPKKYDVTLNLLWWIHNEENEKEREGIKEGWVDDPCLQPEIKCNISFDKSLIKSSDVMVVFNPRFPGDRDAKGIPTSLRELNATKLKKQIWMLHSRDTPINDELTQNEDFMHSFNFFSNYMRTSDVPDTSLEHFMWDNKLTKDFVFNMPVKIEDKNRDAPVVWYSSNCNTRNNRINYVRQLMRYINTHSYGACEHNIDSTSNIFEVLPNYKFYLAFENSNCADFVTDHFWRALATGVVPVVIGAWNILEFEPTFQSIIRADDFPSPLALANYLLYLNNNDTAYRQYLTYKFDKQVTSSFPELFQSTCKSTAAKLCKFRAELKWGHKTAVRPLGLKPDRTCWHVQY